MDEDPIRAGDRMKNPGLGPAGARDMLPPGFEEIGHLERAGPRWSPAACQRGPAQLWTMAGTSLAASIGAEYGGLVNAGPSPPVALVPVVFW
jgi:hypothetical protein